MTVIKSKVERSYWKNAALSVIPDLLIAWAVMKYFDSGWEAFLGTLVGLQVVYFALWIKRTIWSWTLFTLTNRAFMSGHVEDVLARDGYPKPPDFISGPDDYYREIVDNENEDPQIRIKASFELGTLAGITVAGQHQLAIQLRMAMEDALQRYAKRPPAVPAPQANKPKDITFTFSKQELDTIAWLADYGFRLVTSPTDTYHRSIEQIFYHQATAYSSLLDKFERESVPDVLAESETEKDRRFNSQQNRHHTIWSSYPNNR